MGRLLFHLGGGAFLAWIVLVAAKWVFIAGLGGVMPADEANWTDALVSTNEVSEGISRNELSKP